MLHYCKKCGRIIEIDIYDKRNNFSCDCCDSMVTPIPNTFLDEDLDCCFKDKNAEQQFIDEYIKTSPEFDQYLFDHREEILAKKNAALDTAMAHGKAILEEQTHQPECPTCHSRNVQRISGVERGASVALLGLFSRKINKSFKCMNCGYTW